MHITFLTPTPPDISAFGVRALSAYLKRSGHRVSCIFLPGGIEKLRHGGSYRYTFPEPLLSDIAGIASQSDIIGLSFMSQYRDRAIQLTESLRRYTDALIIWGGIHAEVNPEDALRFADAACTSEGEHVLEQLVSRLETARSIHGIPGLWTKKDGRIQAAPLPSLIEDLDTLPFYDMGPDDHYIMDPITSRLRPANNEMLQRILPLMPAPGRRIVSVYRTMTSRGCPHRCTYCANRIKAERNPGERYLRFRSPDHVMAELKAVVERFPFIEAIHFFDDVFTAMPAHDMETLCRRLKEELKLPYYAQVSPQILTRRQLEMFIESGLVFLEMGIQTGSPAVRALYKRPETNDQIMKAVRLIHEYRNRLVTPHYHIIVDNPWESRDDLRMTLDLLTRIPGRFKLCLASLTLYPGTDVYYRALAEGRITDEERDIYRKPFFIPKGRYMNYLIYLTDIPWIPRGVLRWLGGWPANVLDRPVFNAVFDVLRRITEVFRFLGKGIDALIHGEFYRARRFMRRFGRG